MLQRSGIGPADELRAAGIDVLEDSPNVGRNLREHRAMVMQWRVRDELSFNAAHKGAQLLGNIARYYLKHDGVLAAATYELGAWFKTQAELDRPDGQFLIAPYSFDYSQPVMDTESFGGMQFCVYQLRPDSQGSLTVRSSDPTVLPKIAANYYSEPADRKRMIDVVRFAREYVRHPLLKDMVFEETRPTLDYQTDDEIIAAYNKFGNGAYHASGTCRMGADNSSVVDPQLRVRGLEGVRVVDTSITPFIVAGNTQGPAMAMAWRAADLIINRV
jgi:choline dehydrogenase-like flavoprotein